MGGDQAPLPTGFHRLSHGYPKHAHSIRHLNYLPSGESFLSFPRRDKLQRDDAL
ncbi:hypothetical protein RHMOL_Rhmol02G0177200 [Rhododendron molle]|uniref:Uncharacterized protein n=1 Tax=Rhododendron molle TaxID=49168 RepID=A0ACC0PR06_RHOML|nr:hypothetical protein RHMOL_Rhmol02G0177200 [Rhododendron molle]